MVDVFISYSRANLDVVRRLADAIGALGYRVWWDEELPAHLTYGDVITQKIGEARATLVVWSAESTASEWVRAEADLARNQKKLIQTAIDDCTPPLPFNQIQYAAIGDWTGEADHPGWRKAKASLAALCGPPAAVEALAPGPVAPVAQAVSRPVAARPRRPAFRLALVAAAASGATILTVGLLAFAKGPPAAVAMPAATAPAPLADMSAVPAPAARPPKSFAVSASVHGGDEPPPADAETRPADEPGY